MANLDTRSKRASSAAIFGVLLASPLPDGVVGQADRQHIAFSYSGILAGVQQVYSGSQRLQAGSRDRNYASLLRTRVYGAIARDRTYTTR